MKSDRANPITFGIAQTYTCWEASDWGSLDSLGRTNAHGVHWACIGNSACSRLPLEGTSDEMKPPHAPASSSRTCRLSYQ